MGIYPDEPLAAMAAAALTLGGGVLGAWWQRRRAGPPSTSPDAARLLEARFDRLEQIAQGQRFTTRVLAEGKAPVAPPARAPERPAEHRAPH